MYKGIPTLSLGARFKFIPPRKNTIKVKAKILQDLIITQKIKEVWDKSKKSNVSLGIAFGENEPAAVIVQPVKVSTQSVTLLEKYLPELSPYKKYLPYVGAGAGIILLFVLMKRK